MTSDSTPNKNTSTETLIAKNDLQWLLEGIFCIYGYDYRDYREGTLKRSLTRRMQLSGISNFHKFRERVLNDWKFFQKLQQDLSVNVSEFFRCPSFFKALRSDIVPYLKTFPFLRIWIAGCCRGEEAYSLAILLEEEGISDYLLYATDINEDVLQEARSGMFEMDETAEQRYREAGGTHNLQHYCKVEDKQCRFDPQIQQKIVFATHNLATDGAFNSFHLILCRNVMIYFNKKLKKRALGLFHDSLDIGGFFCLGSQESIIEQEQPDLFEEYIANARIYRKKRKALNSHG